MNRRTKVKTCVRKKSAEQRKEQEARRTDGTEPCRYLTRYVLGPLPLFECVVPNPSPEGRSHSRQFRPFRGRYCSRVEPCLKPSHATTHVISRLDYCESISFDDEVLERPLIVWAVEAPGAIYGQFHRHYNRVTQLGMSSTSRYLAN